MVGAPQLYKILVAGRSCHSGDLQWSTPQDGAPGEWHQVDGELRKCEWGIHLTDDPARWWKPGCTVYVAEGEGIVGSCDDDLSRKVVCRRARLIRAATAAELEDLRIYSAGEHVVGGSLAAVALGSSSVVARDSSSVEARDSSSVVAWDSSSVEARGSSRVEAWGSSRVVARDSSSVEARDSSSVVAWDSSRVEARDSSRVEALDSSSVEARDSSSVVAWDSSRVVAARGDVTVISWCGRPGIKLLERAVWIDRSGSAPVVYMAETTAKEAP